MQKKVLFFLVVIACSFICLNKLTANVKAAVKKVTEEDLKKGMGDLESYVHNVTSEELSDEEARVKKILSTVQRLKREKNISEYKKSSQQELEKALTDEISGENGAIEKKSKENADKHVDEEQAARQKESDHYISWFWSKETTPTSNLGREFAAIGDVKQKKDEINKAHTDLVTANKKEVSTVLLNDLRHQHYLFEAVYLKELQACSDACGGDKDRFVECLRQRTNKGNWQDIENPIFFKRFAGSAYEETAKYARSKNIYLNPCDIEHSAQKGKESKILIEKIIALEREANDIRDKIFNPQLQEMPRIDLTEENKEKPVILEDPKDDQGDQGALSQ